MILWGRRFHTSLAAFKLRMRMLTLKCTINLKSVSSASFFTPITHVQERMDKGKTTHVHVQCFFLLSTNKYICISRMYRFCQFTLHSFEANNRNASSVVTACCYLSLNRTATCKQHTDGGASVVQHLRWVHDRAKCLWESHRCAWHRGMWGGNKRKLVPGFTARLMRSARTTAPVCVHPGEAATRPGHG